MPHKNIRLPFKRAIEKHCGLKINHCFQCGKCSAGCPVSSEMEYPPNQIIRMIQLGMKEQVLSSNTMWLCASCHTCSSRCPQKIDVAEVMDYLRRCAYKEKIVYGKEPNLPLFNRVFLRNIELFGRLYEMGLIGMYNIASGELFKDMALAPKMFLKRKIGLFPAVTKNIKEVRDIFKRSGRIINARRDKLFRPKLVFVNIYRKIFPKTSNGK